VQAAARRTVSRGSRRRASPRAAHGRGVPGRSGVLGPSVCKIDPVVRERLRFVRPDTLLGWHRGLVRRRGCMPDNDRVGRQCRTRSVRSCEIPAH
jgi:hypothetical protein